MSEPAVCASAVAPPVGPRHVAVIMDGNGRWARLRGRTRVHGHRAGVLNAWRTAETALDAGVEALTLYAFSEQNWCRPVREVQTLMAALELNLRRGPLHDLARRGVAVRFLGDLSRLPSRIRAATRRLEAATRGGTKLRLSLALSYGGRNEIVRAARRLATRVAQGDLAPGRIDEALFAAELYTAPLPDPDLLIRTSGEQRVSNFLLWQIAYTELYVTPVLWPDFRAAHFLAAIEEYHRRERRFGGVPVAFGSSGHEGAAGPLAGSGASQC